MTDTTENVAVGHEAGRALTTSGNVAIGAKTCSDTSSSSTVAIGQDCHRAHGGSGNVAVGHSALKTAGAGASNTCIGTSSGDLITSGSNNSCLGNASDPSSATASNEVTLGNSSISTLRCQVTSITALSDRRDKTDINTLDLGLDFINELKPVKFKWQSRHGMTKDGTYEAGFIAQDFQQVQKDNDAEYLNMVLESDPDKLEAAPGKLLPILVRAVQELSAKVTALEAG